MVQQWKKDKLEEIKSLMKEYPMVGIVDYYKIPSKQLHEIKKKLRGRARTLLANKKIIELAIKEQLKNNENLVNLLNEAKVPALLFTKENPFKLFKFISNNKSETLAVAGDIAPKDIIIPAGDTGLPPGPAIGDLKAVGLNAAIQGPSIHIKEDKVVAKKGDEISEALAGVLSKLNIKPMEIGLNVKGIYENGIVFNADTLDINEQEYYDNILYGASRAFNLAYNANYLNELTVPMKLSEAFIKAINLGINASIVNEKTAEHLLAKANMQMLSLASVLPEEARGNVSVVSKEVEQKADSSAEGGEAKAEEKDEKKASASDSDESKEEDAAAGLGALFG